MLGQKEDKDPEDGPHYKGFKLPKAITLSMSMPMCFSTCNFSFPIKFLFFSLLSTSSPEFFLDKTDKSLGLRTLQVAPVVQWLGLPVQELKSCFQLLLIAVCCKLPLTVVSVQNHCGYKVMTVPEI